MTNGFTGFQTPGSSSSEFNTHTFIIKQMTNRMATATVVKVISVTNAGNLSSVGFVDIQPEVDQLDGAGVRIAHGVIYKCPYFRYQGGSNAIILDPQVGDLGIAIFADRDISSVIANKGQAAPGSARRFDMSDGMYIGGILNGTPNQYVQFSSSGITISSPTGVKLQAPSVEIDCQTFVLNATSSATVTTPIFTVNGAFASTGLATVGTFSSGAAIFNSTLLVGGKNIGASHEHNLTGGGTTLGVV